MVINPNHKLRGSIKGLSRGVDVDAAPFEMRLPFPSCSIRKCQAAELYGVDAIPALFIIDGRGKVIYGDVGFDPSLKFILAQKLGLIDEAAAGA
jgi:hypothetical protein